MSQLTRNAGFMFSFYQYCCLPHCLLLRFSRVKKHIKMCYKSFRVIFIDVVFVIRCSCGLPSFEMCCDGNVKQSHLLVRKSMKTITLSMTKVPKETINHPTYIGEYTIPCGQIESSLSKDKTNTTKHF